MWDTQVSHHIVTNGEYNLLEKVQAWVNLLKKLIYEWLIIFSGLGTAYRLVRLFFLSECKAYARSN